MTKTPLVEYFNIEGLYGYRNIGLDSSTATTILIAKNGSGKTTLLGAMYAFLRGEFGRFSNLEFYRITCKFHGATSEVELRADQLESIMTVPDSPEFLHFVRRFEIDPVELLDYVDNDYANRRNFRELDKDPIFEKVVSKTGYDYEEAQNALKSLFVNLRNRSPEIAALKEHISSFIGDREVLYLPTYRRIELPLSDNLDGSRRRRKRSITDQLGIARRSFFFSEIQFGLSDISHRLGELNNELLAKSNFGYRQISSRIVTDLLDGSFERQADDRILPERDELQLFLSRIRQGYGRGLSYPVAEIPDIDRLFSPEHEIDAHTEKFLKYFLGQLKEVIDASKEIEGLVESFVVSCNQYLSSKDSTADIANAQSLEKSYDAFDEKRLELDLLTLELSVTSASGANVPLDSLSSGEKQMISLFARLYLYPGEKIVLIDEPELSLSIDWQRRILVDIAKAPTCRQLIAITHSPFVFDNDLDQFARGLRFSISERQLPVETNDLFDQSV